MRSGKRRLYADESVWIALALDGEMREAIKLALKHLLHDDWIVLSSAYSLNRLIGLETSGAAFIEYITMLRRLCAEIGPLEADDFERSAVQMLIHQCSLSTAIHLTFVKKMQCDAILTLSPEIKEKSTLPVFHPTEF